MRKYILPITAHGYFWLTILGWILLKTSFDWGWMIFCSVGCHTTLYPFLGAIMASEAGFAWLVYAMLVFWGLYCIAFVGAYIWSVMKKGYLPMAVVALIDAVFSVFIVTNAIVNVGFMWEHLALFVGVLSSLGMTWILFCGVRNSADNTEVLPSD